VAAAAAPVVPAPVVVKAARGAAAVAVAAVAAAAVAQVGGTKARALRMSLKAAARPLRTTIFPSRQGRSALRFRPLFRGGSG
jgi:hypothetical protein